MKAIVCRAYGPPEDVLEIVEVDPPSPAPGEVLVRVHSTTVAGDDWHLVRGLPYVARLSIGLRAPKGWRPGLDVAGTVEEVGADVRRFRPGDEVFGWCTGGLAEWVAMPEASLAPKPPALSFDEAAALPTSGFTAMQAVRDAGEVRAGRRVLVNGAAGGVGTLAVQVAAALGAEVTGVCSERNFERVRALGADHLIDYATTDFTATGERWDTIVDMIGNRPLRACRRALTPRGILVLVGGRGGRWFMGTDRWLRALALSPFVGQRLRPLIHEDRLEDLEELAAMVEAGTLRPMLDRHYPLEDAAEAIAYLERRRARGKVVIRVEGAAGSAGSVAPTAADAAGGVP